ncbi:hypothetical protein NSTC745_05238 [Nostoc sp. DSM 114161]|jgi:hypothetical protein
MQDFTNHLRLLYIAVNFHLNRDLHLCKLQLNLNLTALQSTHKGQKNGTFQSWYTR